MKEMHEKIVQVQNATMQRKEEHAERQNSSKKVILQSSIQAEQQRPAPAQPSMIKPTQKSINCKVPVEQRQRSSATIYHTKGNQPRERSSLNSLIGEEDPSINGDEPISINMPGGEFLVSRPFQNCYSPSAT